MRYFITKNMFLYEFYLLQIIDLVFGYIMLPGWVIEI